MYSVRLLIHCLAVDERVWQVSASLHRPVHRAHGSSHVPQPPPATGPTRPPAMARRLRRCHFPPTRKVHLALHTFPSPIDPRVAHGVDSCVQQENDAGLHRVPLHLGFHMSPLFAPGLSALAEVMAGFTRKGLWRGYSFLIASLLSSPSHMQCPDPICVLQLDIQTS
ncbi:hypothetical protein Micbo1qcDRAFT_41333 [Microdochium bolleyi]|uniref:Uncharacterized protein n=1 Tax=Microdochium bolleyi TaxID=196109 RepID=A0A136JA96_9PEZI|nr:hypothetical protein Micbo1qcDRAFT_41333 [Microdochium bolleyi]